jgi:hypothetical protein
LPFFACSQKDVTCAGTTVGAGVSVHSRAPLLATLPDRYGEANWIFAASAGPTVQNPSVR